MMCECVVVLCRRECEANNGVEYKIIPQLLTKYNKDFSLRNICYRIVLKSVILQQDC